MRVTLLEFGVQCNVNFTYYILGYSHGIARFGHVYHGTELPCVNPGHKKAVYPISTKLDQKKTLRKTVFKYILTNFRLYNTKIHQSNTKCFNYIYSTPAAIKEIVNFII